MATKYYCKYCGDTASTIKGLTSRGCFKNPDGKYHVLYEGSEKSKYACKYCGDTASTIKGLTARPCHKNPNGKYHVPL